METTRKPIVISLFSGALGLDLGLEDAGFEIRVAVECNPVAVQTIRNNRPDIQVIDKKIQDVPSAEIIEKARIAPDDIVVVTGGPSCQTFSTAGSRLSLGDPRGQLFEQFIRVVRDLQPDYFVMENVRGMLSAAVKHRPLIERGPGCPPLEPEEQLGSAMARIVTSLKELNYSTLLDLVNATDFGVPQLRQRVIFIGSRDGRAISALKPTHSVDGKNGLPVWRTLRDALEGLQDASPEFNPLAPSRRKYLEKVPEGGNWRNLPEELQAEALGAAYVSWGGRSGFFRRLAWDKPSPALTTRPDSKATCLCHPTILRALSIREYMRIQQFPDEWTFAGSTSQKYLQVGNAVPVGLGNAIGESIKRTMVQPIVAGTKGQVRCESATLLASLRKLPLTKLNPPRMREDGTLKAAKEWLSGLSSNRLGLVHDLFVEEQEALPL